VHQWNAVVRDAPAALHQIEHCDLFLAFLVRHQSKLAFNEIFQLFSIALRIQNSGGA
jgi:hypothetical protein